MWCNLWKASQIRIIRLSTQVYPCILKGFDRKSHYETNTIFLHLLQNLYQTASLQIDFIKDVDVACLPDQSLLKQDCMITLIPRISPEISKAKRDRICNVLIWWICIRIYSSYPAVETCATADRETLFSLAVLLSDVCRW